MYSHTSVLVSFRTRQTLYSSHFEDTWLSAFWELVALAGTYMSQDAASQEKKLHCSILLTFNTPHKFRNKLTMPTEIPLYVLSFLCFLFFFFSFFLSFGITRFLFQAHLIHTLSLQESAVSPRSLGFSWEGMVLETNIWLKDAVSKCIFNNVKSQFNPVQLNQLFD